MLFADMISTIEEQLCKLPSEKQTAFNRLLDITFEEWVMFQNKKSEAVAAGRMEVENGQWIYATLGSTVEEFNNRPIAVKYLMTEIFKQLLTPRA